MLRTAALLSVLIAAPSAAFAEDDKPPDTVSVQGKALVLSCSEWKRNADGSWGNIGPLRVGDDIVKEVTLRGKETKVLEEKCRNAAPPTAAAAPTGAPAKHMGHIRHGAQAPQPGGT
jgi:hypothetical protein